jgi:hypothetical protein
MQAILEFLSNKDNLAIIFAVLFALSEAIGLIPSVKQSSVFQIVMDVLRKMRDFLLPPKV